MKKALITQEGNMHVGVVIDGSSVVFMVMNQDINKVHETLERKGVSEHKKISPEEWAKLKERV